MLFAVEFEKALRDAAPIRYAANEHSDPMHRPMGIEFPMRDGGRFYSHVPRSIVADYLYDQGRDEDAEWLKSWPHGLDAATLIRHIPYGQALPANSPHSRILADALHSEGRHEEAELLRSHRGEVAEHNGKLRKVPDPYRDDDLQQYLDTALWSTHGDAPWHELEEDHDPGERDYDNLDRHYDLTHFTPQSLIQAKDDLERFRDSLSDEAKEEIDTHRDPTMHAHDLWLTRNHHGTGFWDGGWNHGDELSDAAHRLGEQDIEVEHHGDTDPERVGEYSLHLRGGR